MPSRSRGRRASPPAPTQEDDDVDFEVSYSSDEEDGEEGDDSEEGSEEEGAPGSEPGSGSDSEEEEDEEEEDEERSDADEEVRESVGEVCGSSVQASRVPGGAPAAERGNTPTCPVCMEAWTSEGPHRISCIPCGHVYGRSCLERWLTQRGNTSTTCPQCARRFKRKDIINLYAPEVVVPNNDLEKQVVSCMQKVESLGEVVRKQGKMLEEIKAEKEHRSVDNGVSKRQKIAEHAGFGSSNCCCLVLQNELLLDGARVMGIDASNQIILASRKAPGLGQEHVFTKINMLSTHQGREIQLPPGTKVVKDICILHDGSALFASLGRRLSLFSMMTESVVLQCDLPAPGWSCSADDSGSHHVCAGLQDGRILVFDIRQTSRPLHSMAGLSTHLVHTLHCVTDNNGSRKVLSASAIGPCMWDPDGSQSKPYLLLQTDDQRVCFSLACAPPSSDTIVASFRPKADSSGDAAPSQVYPSQTQAASGPGKQGQHTVVTRTPWGVTPFVEGRTCYGSVSEVRMCKSAIIPYGNNNQHLFAYGDESLRGVRTWQLPWFGMHTELRPHREPILDLRFVESPAGGRYLGCLSNEKLQVFRVVQNSK